jgi:anthranilate phosphoribosyltransferase
MSTTADEPMKEFLRRVAIGPKGSRDLARDEAREAMETVLVGGTSDVRSALFLVAMRLKGETAEELLGMLDALRGQSERVELSLERVVELVDPYDGFARTPRWGLFTSIVLASCGVPTVIHGGQGIPPKEGCTHRDILESMGGRVDDTTVQAGEAITKYGWGYVDLSRYCPALNRLTPLRREMVKRPALALLEKMTMPIRGSRETLFVSGYVHSAYEELMGSLAHASGYTGSLVIRGGEGHTDLSIQRAIHASSTDGQGERVGLELDPVEAGVVSELPLDGVPIDPQRIAQAGVAALEGEEGVVQDTILWTAGALLSWLGSASDCREGVSMARASVKEGRAGATMNAGLAR